MERRRPLAAEAEAVFLGAIFFKDFAAAGRCRPAAALLFAAAVFFAGRRLDAAEVDAFLLAAFLALVTFLAAAEEDCDVFLVFFLEAVVFLAVADDDREVFLAFFLEAVTLFFAVADDDREVFLAFLLEAVALLAEADEDCDVFLVVFLEALAFFFAAADDDLVVLAFLLAAGTFLAADLDLDGLVVVLFFEGVFFWSFFADLAPALTRCCLSFFAGVAAVCCALSASDSLPGPFFTYASFCFWKSSMFFFAAFSQC